MPSFIPMAVRVSCWPLTGWISRASRERWESNDAVVSAARYPGRTARPEGSDATTARPGRRRSEDGARGHRVLPEPEPRSRLPGPLRETLHGCFRGHDGGGYADAVATGTSALFVAVAALDLPKGSEVLV